MAIFILLPFYFYFFKVSLNILMLHMVQRVLGIRVPPYSQQDIKN